MKQNLKSKIYKIILEKEYFHFCSAHFIIFDEKKRETLHGHNYYLSVEIVGNKLVNGKLIDISVIKPKVKKICDELDHKLLIPEKCSNITIEKDEHSISILHDKSKFVYPSDDVLLLPIENSTMENLAEYILFELKDEFNIHNNVTDISVTVEETNGQKGLFCYSYGETNE